MARQKQPIKWQLLPIKVKDIKLNPNNPKIPNDAGMERLRKSLEKFGHIYDGIANTDLSLIDGHSRIAQLKPTDTAMLFLPNRKLTKKEYTELSSVFDIAVAGDPDFEIIIESLGEAGAIEWGLDFNDASDEDVDKFFEGDGEGVKENKNTLVLTFSKTMYKKVTEKLNEFDETKEDLFLIAVGLK